MSKTILTAGLALTLMACGDESPTELRQSEEPEPDNREILSTPSFAMDINEILLRRGCASHNCHGGPGGRASFMLSTSAAENYAAMVGVNATTERYKIVLPTSADSSYLVIKLEGRQVIGLTMPLGADPLDNIDITNIRNWIDTGAPNN